MKLEQIIWEDAFSQDEWTDQIESDPCLCETIGYVIKENEKIIAISHTKQVGEEVYCCAIIIPKSCVVSRTSIKGIVDGRDK